MEIIDFLFKYFKFNRNSDRPFAYSFICLNNYKIIDLNIKETEKILFEHSNSYYEYSFDKNEIKEFKKLVLNEDKCIISSDMYYGLFFDSYKNEILFYGFKNIYDKKEILKIETIYNKPIIIKKYYESRIGNPSQAFKDFLYQFFYESIIAGRYEYDRNIFSNLTEDERDVVMDIIIDYATPVSSPLFDICSYFKEVKITNYLKFMYSCNILSDENRFYIICKLFERNKEIIDLELVKKELNNDSGFFGSKLHHFIQADDKTFKILAKEALTAKFSDMREDSFLIYLNRYGKISPDNSINIRYKILNKLDDNCFSFVDELLSYNEINDVIANKLVNKYQCE